MSEAIRATLDALLGGVLLVTLFVSLFVLGAGLVDVVENPGTDDLP